MVQESKIHLTVRAICVINQSEQGGARESTVMSQIVFSVPTVHSDYGLGFLLHGNVCPMF